MPALDPRRFGTDLRLLPHPELVKSSRDPGHDLSTAPRRAGARADDGELIDLDTVGGAENFMQALLLRFLTPVGELAHLGHPDYGSRLAELIGELNTETNRNRAKLYVLQALAQEPRVKEVLAVEATQSRRNPAQMDIRISLLPVDSETPLNLVFPFFLERGGTP